MQPTEAAGQRAVSGAAAGSGRLVGAAHTVQHAAIGRRIVTHSATTQQRTVGRTTTAALRQWTNGEWWRTAHRSLRNRPRSTVSQWQ